MKQGKSIGAVAKQIKEELEQKKDYVGKTTVFHMTPEGKFNLVGVQGPDKSLMGVTSLTPTKYARDQIADHIKMPRTYMNRLLESGAQGQAVFSDNVNYWFEREPAKRMIRTIGPTLRAYLSDRYRQLDNWDLMQAVMPTFEEKKLVLQSCDLTDTSLFLKATLPTLRSEVKVGDTVEAGICIRNSEIGASSLRVEPMIMVLRCTNGMIMNSAVRKYHVGRNQYDANLDIQHLLTDATRHQSDKAFWMSVRDIVANSLTRDVFEAEVDKLRVAADLPIIGKVDQVIEVTKKTFNLGDDIGSKIMENLIRGNDMTCWGLSNAVTATSQEVEDYEQATRLEEIGGELVELTPKDWKKIAEAA